MKRLSLYILSLVLICCNFGCSHDDDLDLPPLPPGTYGAYYYLYVLNLKILDQNGNNVVESVDSSVVSHITFEDYDFVYINPAFVTITESLGKDIYKNQTDIRVLEDRENRKVISFINSIKVNEPHSSTYEVSVSCQPLFGDSKTHIIKSKWKRNGYRNVCTEIKFDGKKCPFEIFEDYDSPIIPGKTYLLEATVTLDR